LLALSLRHSLANNYILNFKKMTKKERIKLEAKNALLNDCKIKPSGMIFINITSVSRSGMSRRMRVYTLDMRDITEEVGVLVDCGVNDKGISVTGCGMDMTFWLADHLTFALWGAKKRTMKTFKGNGGSCLDWKCL
jgi:hypothetical protein